MIALSNSFQSPQNVQQDSITSCPVIPAVGSSTSDNVKTNNSNSTHNDMFSLIAIAVTLIAVAVALIGQHKSNQLDKFKEDFDPKLKTAKAELENKLNSLNDEIINLRESINKERLATSRLSHILQKHNESLYDSFKVIVEENKSYELSKVIMLNYHITRLYNSCLCHDNETATNIDLFDTFSYLKENGRIEDIQHLVFLSQNHPNAKDREQAGAVIGYIKARQKQ